MISNLLKKDFVLSAHPTLYMFMIIGALVLVPAYPYGMVFFFGCLGLYFSTLNGRENNDIFYSAILPLDKKDIVKGKCLFFITFELIQILITTLIAFIKISFIDSPNNDVGIECNIAFFGFGFIIYSIFNYIFLTKIYKSSYKIGIPFVISLIFVILAIILMELISHIPYFSWIDGVTFSDLQQQIPILIVGLLLFIFINILAYKKATKNFEKVDL